VTSARLLISHRHLLCRTAWSELRSRYAGSILGLAWAILGPWSILGLYAVVYLKIFAVKVPGLESSTAYVFFVFSGLVPYFMTAESLMQGLGAVVTNRSVLENTVFPIDLAPAKAVLMSQTPMLAGLPVLLVGTLAIDRLSWATLAVVPLWGLHVVGLLGLAWILSLLNVVFRDLGNLMNVVLMALLIASPFAYTADRVPESLRPIITFNPFAYWVQAYQDVLIFGRLPGLSHCLFLVVLSCGLFVLGSWFFSRAKRVIVDYV